MGWITRVSVLSALLVTSTLQVSAADAPPRQETAQATTPATVPAAAAVQYFEVPVFGQLGTDVTPLALELAFNEAEQAHASYIVLLFDSPGGDASAISNMVHTVSSHPKVTSVAFVRRATGTAALLAASCSKLYVYKAGIWGSASEDDCLQLQACNSEIDQLIISSHRSPKVLKAMADWNSELHLQMTDGKPYLQSTPTADTRILKQRGSGLALTPQDMVTCKVADGVCATMGDVRRGLGVNDWASCGNRGAEIVESLRQVPQPSRIVVDLQSEPGSSVSDAPQSPVDRKLVRNEAYYKARAAEQDRAYHESRQAENRAENRIYSERRRLEDEARQEENRAALRRQNEMEQARKRREMDSLGHNSRW